MRNRLSYLLLVVGCLAAAAGGGYFAVRQSVPAAATGTLPQASNAMPVNQAGSASSANPQASAAGSNPSDVALPGQVGDPNTQASRAEAPARTHRVPARDAVEQARDTRTAAPRASTSTPAKPVKNVARANRTPAPLASAEWQAIQQQLPDGDPAPPDPALEDQEPPLEQFVISSDSVIGLSLETPVSSETARVEDPVRARITRDVKIGDKVAIPAGTVVRGTVTEVERGGKLKTRARLGLTFTTIRMPDGADVAISTDAIFREGDPPGDAATKKIGASAVAGTILGAIFGGGKGALIGGAAGAAGGTAMAEAGDRHPAAFPAGATITVRLRAPVTVTVEQ